MASKTAQASAISIAGLLARVLAYATLIVRMTAIIFRLAIYAGRLRA
jgi:hypothetical protein